MAARGLVNGRGPRRRRGRDSAKRVVSETIYPFCSPKEQGLIVRLAFAVDAEEDGEQDGESPE